MSPRHAALLAWVLVAAALLAAPGPAAAQGGVLAAARSACDAALSKRLTDLAGAKAKVDAAGHVTAGDKASLDAQIDAATTGLTQLKGPIDADTTLLKLRSDCRLIVTNFRVYLLLLPKARLVVAAARVQAAAESLTKLATLLQSRIKADQARGKSVAAAQGFVSDITVKAQAAVDAAKGVPGGVIPLEATGYPGNRSTLIAERTSIGTAHDALAGAVKAARQAIDLLKAG